MRGTARPSRSQVPGGLRCALVFSALVAAADGSDDHSRPVFHFRPGDDLVTSDLNWEPSKGLRIELDLEFKGYGRSGRLTPIRLHGVDGRGKATTVALTFRDRGRLFFHILPSDIDAYVICDQTPPGSTPTWLRGEQHHVSCGWGEDGQFKLYADHVKARAHRPTRDRQFPPAKITSVQITDEAGPVTECRIWLSGKGIGPRETRAALPMKLVPFSEYTISPDVALPLPMQFAISDSEVFKSSFPRIVVECPQGIAPYRWMSIRYVFYGWFPYSWYRKDEFVFREVERDGKPYMRYVFSIPRTKASRTLRSYFYPTWLVLRTDRPAGKTLPVYLYAEWDGGRQEPAAIDIEVVSFGHDGVRFEHIPAGLWADPFCPDIRNYCRKLGINYVVTNMPEGDKEGYSGMLAEARARLGPDIGIDYYSRKIWWRKRLPKWPEEIAFTRIDGSVDTRFPCLSYRGPMWYEDRERAKQLILKGFDGVTTDIECDVYRGCFHKATLARFRKYLAERHPKLGHIDPRVFEKKPEDYPELHAAWVQFQGRLMSEYYAMLADGITEGAKELGLAKSPRLTIYNDERYGRKSADLTHLFAEPRQGVRLLLAPPNYRSHWLAGDEVRASVKKFPNAYPCPHIGRPGSGVTDEEAVVYEIFANGARGFVMFAWTWNDGREVHQFARGLANIRKIEELISRSRILDDPFDLSESVRIRAVGNGDEKFIIVAQYPSAKWELCRKATFTIPTQGRARVVDLRTDEQVATIAPGDSTIAIEFADFGVFPLHVQPIP